MAQVQEHKIFRKYRKEFEDEYDWVKKCPDGTEAAYCEHCEVSITPTSSCLSTHESSARHQKNVYDIKKTGHKTPIKPKEEGPKPSIWKKDYDKTRRFREEWLQRFPWVRRDPDGERFGYCPACKIKLEPKAKRLEDHEMTLKHQTNTGIKSSGIKKKKSAVIRPAIKKFGKRKKIRKLKRQREETPDTDDEEENHSNEFDKINDISELMDELPGLLEEEEANEEASTSKMTSAPKQTQKKRGRPRIIKQEKEGEEELDMDERSNADESGLGDAEEVKIKKEHQPLRKPKVEKDLIAEELAAMEGIEVPETEKRKIKQDRHVSPAKPETRIKNPPTKRVQALQSKKEVAPVVQIPKIIRKPRLRQTEPTQSQESQVDSRVQIIETTPIDLSLMGVDNSGGENVTTVTIGSDGVTIMGEDGVTSQHQGGGSVNLSDYVNIIIGPDGVEHELVDDLIENDYEIIKNESIPADEKIVEIISTSPRRRRYTRRPPGEPKGSSWRKEYEQSRRFQPEWLIEHPWVRREVRKTGEMAFCPYCNIDLEPRIVRLRQHEKTSKHSKNEEIHSKRVFDDQETFFDQQVAYEVIVGDPKSGSPEKKFRPLTTKTEVRPRYKCDLCNLRFVAQRNLFFHLKEHYEPGFKVIEQEEPQQEEILMTVEEIEAPPPVKKEIKHEYQAAWERIFPWLQKAVDDDWAFCSLCQFPMEPKLSVIKNHDKHRRHVKLVAQQDNPTQFEVKPDVHGILAEFDKKQIRKKNSIVGNADVVVDGEGKQRYQCKICKKVLVKTSFAVHLRIHQGLRPFKCTMCEWAFKQAYDLKHHVESIHNHIKAHQCELCGKEFTRKYTLRLHLKSHTDVRDFKCITCHRGFFTRGKLVEHERTHTGEKPFLCDQCGRGFRIKYDMVQHRLKTHFGMPPKRRKLHHKMPMTTTYITTDDGQIINEQGEMMTVEDSVEVEMEEHTVHTVHTIDGVMHHEPKHQFVFISETEGVYLTKE